VISSVAFPRHGGRHLIVLLSVLFSSCLATSSSLDLREKTPVPSGETVVFGRVNVIARSLMTLEALH